MMFYLLVRVAISLAATAGIYFSLRKKYIKLSKREMLNSVMLITICICAVLTFVPFEDYLFRFSSPAKAFHYWDGSSKILFVADSHTSSFVMGKRGSKYTTIALSRENDKWLTHNIYRRTIQQRYEIDGWIFLKILTDSRKTCSLILITHMGTPEREELELSDNYASEFSVYREKHVSYYYTVMDAPVDNYMLYKDGELVCEIK